MFVRWKRRSRAPKETWTCKGGPAGSNNWSFKQRWYEEHGDLLIATLVKSVRTPKGPRQRTVAYLGSISEKLAADPSERARFWHNYNCRLFGWDEQERARIEAALESVVAKPDERAGTPTRHSGTAGTVGICGPIRVAVAGGSQAEATIESVQSVSPGPRGPRSA